MKGIEEGLINNKIDEMHPGRGRVRTSSQVFPTKDFAARQHLSMSLSNTDDLKKVIAQVKALEFSSLERQEN